MNVHWNPSTPIAERAKFLARHIVENSSQATLKVYILELEAGMTELTKQGVPVEGDELKEWIAGLKACLIL